MARIRKLDIDGHEWKYSIGDENVVIFIPGGEGMKFPKKAVAGEEAVVTPGAVKAFIRKSVSRGRQAAIDANIEKALRDADQQTWKAEFWDRILDQTPVPTRFEVTVQANNREYVPKKLVVFGLGEVKRRLDSELENAPDQTYVCLSDGTHSTWMYIPRNYAHLSHLNAEAVVQKWQREWGTGVNTSIMDEVCHFRRKVEVLIRIGRGASPHKVLYEMGNAQGLADIVYQRLQPLNTDLQEIMVEVIAELDVESRTVHFRNILSGQSAVRTPDRLRVAVDHTMAKWYTGLKAKERDIHCGKSQLPN